MYRCLVIIGWLGFTVPSLTAAHLSWRDQMSELEASILGERTPRREFECHSEKIRGTLGYDLSFRVYFQIWTRASDFEPAADASLSFRAASLDVPGEELFVRRRGRFSSFGTEKPEEFGAHDAFLAGPGRYRLDWMLADDLGRICSGHEWLELKPEAPDTPLRLAQGEMEPSHRWGSRHLSLAGAGDSGLSLKVLLNIPPFLESPPEMDPATYSRLRQSLQAIAADSRVSRLELVAFSPRDREILFRTQSSGSTLDLAPFRSALVDRPGRHVVTIGSYSSNERIEFFRRLIVQEVLSEEADVILFLGPDGFTASDLDNAVSHSSLKEMPPLFYIRFLVDGGPLVSDPISRLILRSGGRAYPVRNPYQFWKGLDEVLEWAGRPRESWKVPSQPSGGRD